MITNNQFMLMINLKVPYVITEIIRHYKIPASEAFELFYKSETYSLLSNKGTYYWGESAAFVTESFIREEKGLEIEPFIGI